MKIAVYDTRVVKKNGEVMHFDIFVPEEVADLDKIYKYGRVYLKTKNQEAWSLTTEQCKFCHVENATPEIAKAIQEDGYFIYEMEGCKS